ncbi:MAG: hypothetical protein AAGE85_13935 [Pseudomonadota bacterium]
MKSASAILAACALIAGCAAEPKLRTAEIQYYSEQAPVAAGKALAHAGIDDSAEETCIRVVDQRRRTVAQGWSLPKEQIRDWLSEGIESRLGVSVRYSDQPPDTGPYVALETLYIKHISTSMAGVTVLRVYGTESSRAVRGNKTRMNWNGTSREFSRLLSQSLDAAIAALPLRAVIRENCSAGEDTIDRVG